MFWRLSAASTASDWAEIEDADGDGRSVRAPEFFAVGLVALPCEGDFARFLAWQGHVPVRHSEQGVARIPDGGGGRLIGGEDRAVLAPREERQGNGVEHAQRGDRIERSGRAVEGWLRVASSMPHRIVKGLRPLLRAELVPHPDRKEILCNFEMLAFDLTLIAILRIARTIHFKVLKTPVFSQVCELIPKPRNGARPAACIAASLLVSTNRRDCRASKGETTRRPL